MIWVGVRYDKNKSFFTNVLFCFLKWSNNTGSMNYLWNEWNKRHDFFNTNNWKLLKRGLVQCSDDEVTTIVKLCKTSNNAIASVIYYYEYSMILSTLHNNFICWRNNVLKCNSNYEWFIILSIILDL